MPFISTRGEAPAATLREALFRGLAPDGGLYQPHPIPILDPEERTHLLGLPWPEMATHLSGRLLSEALDPATLGEMVPRALNFPIPLVPLRERVFILELFRGPTLAFKDVGARFMAALTGHFHREGNPPLTILTATSGDTGGAVAQAFLGLPGIRVVVLFPDGQVTPRQERQFSTLGGNVTAVAVQGDFDACQALAKGAFQDLQLREEVALTSANSINVGRFLPQSFYYWHARAQLCRAGAGEDLLFAVPSGNFGNLAAGLLAKAMGLPEVRFLAATNLNDEVPLYLRTGVFTPRPSLRTLSTAMDVGNPSNFHRIIHLYDGRLDRIRAHVAGHSVTDAETRAAIRRVWEETGYVLDPHSAVGMKAMEQELEGRPGAVGILLATAHPAKFAEVVEPILGETLPVPEELARCLEKQRIVVPLEPRAEALRDLLLRG